MVNVALVVHSDEALLAIGFIFGVHFFNSHLRRSKFPMDEIMFTGSAPEEEYREERGREWKRIEAEDRVDEKVVEDPHPVFRAVARVFGNQRLAFRFGNLGSDYSRIRNDPLIAREPRAARHHECLGFFRRIGGLLLFLVSFRRTIHREGQL